jgi:signal transduction histidine kinase
MKEETMVNDSSAPAGLSRGGISLQKTFLLFLLLAAAIFMANFLINYIHVFFSDIVLWQHALIDSVVLTVMTLPPIYFFWFGPLYREIRERKKAENDITRLSRKLMTAAEEERKKLALELHDEGGRRITALQFGIESLLLLHPRREEEWREILLDLNELVQQLGDLIRDFSSSLRPDMLDHLGIEATLNWYVAEIARTVPGLGIEFDAIGLQKRLPSHIELILYRVAQECLTNVMKHARAGHVDILLTCSHPRVILSVKDNGVGFDSSVRRRESEESRQGLGLLGIRERVAAAGGACQVFSSPGRGTTVRVELPITQ